MPDKFWVLETLDVVPVARIEAFSALKFVGQIECFRDLNFSKFESFRVLKFSIFLLKGEAGPGWEMKESKFGQVLYFPNRHGIKIIEEHN